MKINNVSSGFIFYALGAVCSALLSLIVSVSLVRIAGSAAYGYYVFYAASATVLSTLAQHGLPTLTVRETSRLKASGRNSKVAELWIWTQKKVSVQLGVVTFLTALPLSFLTFKAELNTSLIIILLTLTALTTMTVITSSFIRGAGKPLTSIVGDGLVKNLSFLLWLTIAIETSPDALTTTSNLLFALASSTGLALAFNLYYLRKSVVNTSAYPASTNQNTNQAWHWNKSLNLFAALALVQALTSNVEVFLLTLMSRPEDAGNFRALIQITLPLSFAIVIANQYLHATISYLHTSNRMKELQSLMLKASLFTSIFAIMVGVLLVVTGKKISELLFDDSIVYNPVTFYLIVASHVVNVLLGSVGALLNMTGNPKATIKAIFIALILGCTSSVILIPHLGTSGAAIGMLITTSTWNILLRRSAIKLLQIESSLLLYMAAQLIKSTKFKT